MRKDMHVIGWASYCLLILSLIKCINAAFILDRNDYDAYGVKIGMNDHLLVLAQNNQQPPAFFIQFSPYNTTLSPQCSLTYPNSTNTFIYTVTLPKQPPSNQTQFFFAGELTDGSNTSFIGVATHRPTTNNSNNSQSTSSCDNSFSYSVQYLQHYKHQEYFVLAADPLGLFAYGFANEFISVFDSKNTSQLNTWSGNMTWPHKSFLPHAVDIHGQFGVIAGFIENVPNATAKYVPMIYLINFDTSATLDRQVRVVDQYQPSFTNGSWQDLLTNINANAYSAKYDMSVSIDDQGKILVGMQFINRVFLFSVNVTNPTNLTSVSRHTNGRSLGNGKSIAWLNDGIAAIMMSVYTLDYQWIQSQVVFFDIYKTGYISTTTPLSVFPNSHQLLPSNLSPVFLNIVSSPSSSLALLDNKGKILLFSPTPPGYHPSIEDTGSMPVLTSPVACSPGTYRNRTGVHDCLLCPMGTKNPGSSSTQCMPCATESFCPLGSVADIPQSALKNLSQVVAYPQSPESVIFDEILLHNMFSIGSGRCLIVSPLFWTLMVAGLVILIIIVMEILKIFVKHPRSRRFRYILKTVFRHTDLIGEGEYWVGGLASFAVIVLVSFSFAFSNAYLKQYPIEKSSPSYFTCDTSLRNAKFDTNVQSLSVPFTNVEQEMLDLLNHQNFTFHVDFINTLVKCDAISIDALFGQTWSTIRWLSCSNTDFILTLSIELPYQQISVRLTLSDPKTIGGLRIGLSSPGHEQTSHKLEELHFYKSFSKLGYMMAKTIPVALAMTKIINETKPMIGEESEYGGIYVPTFTMDPNSLLVSTDQYVRSSEIITTLVLVVSETPYYVKNVQQPIARQPEIIFRNLLFTVVCLEIFGLVFIFRILVLKPIHTFLSKKCATDKAKATKKMNGDLFYTIESNRTSETGENDYVTSRF